MKPDAIAALELSKQFAAGRTIFRSGRSPIRAVNRVSFTLAKGETLAIVGESGSGKTTLARMLVGLEQASSGQIHLHGKDAEEIRKQGPAAWGRLIQMVFQDPVASLNPRKTVKETLEAPLKLLCGYNPSHRARRVKELLHFVQMPLTTLAKYPHELSGGQAQRIAVARALAAEAEIIVFDEALSALDVSVQAQVLLLLQDLRKEFGLSYLFISHELAVVEAIADRVAVMLEGDIVESAKAEKIFSKPEHPYTRSLLLSALSLPAAP